MKDLTQGSITRNILEMAGPIAAGMIFQTLYLLVDLYFVASLGDASVAGVGAAGTIMFIVMALTQVLGVGAVAKADGSFSWSGAAGMAQGQTAMTRRGFSRCNSTTAVPRACEWRGEARR